jgi:hypothetical protein
MPAHMQRVEVGPVLYRGLVEVSLRIGCADLAEDRSG